MDKIKAALAKAAKEKGMTSSDFSQVSKTAATKYGAMFNENNELVSIKSKQPLDAATTNKILQDTLSGINAWGAARGAGAGTAPWAAMVQSMLNPTQPDKGGAGGGGPGKGGAGQGGTDTGSVFTGR